MAHSPQIRPARMLHPAVIAVNRRQRGGVARAAPNSCRTAAADERAHAINACIRLKRDSRACSDIVAQATFG
ncbi:hypothetical protein AXW83_03585 [Bosea sp. PAMC 26642]|nr:hypothetical protein AXW83_03585 [Bosea sp. PAMC 26642]